MLLPPSTGRRSRSKNRRWTRRACQHRHLLTRSSSSKSLERRMRNGYQYCDYPVQTSARVVVFLGGFFFGQIFFSRGAASSLIGFIRLFINVSFSLFFPPSPLRFPQRWGLLILISSSHVPSQGIFLFRSPPLYPDTSILNSDHLEPPWRTSLAHLCGFMTPKGFVFVRSSELVLAA